MYSLQFIDLSGKTKYISFYCARSLASNNGMILEILKGNDIVAHFKFMFSFLSICVPYTFFCIIIRLKPHMGHKLQGQKEKDPRNHSLNVLIKIGTLKKRKRKNSERIDTICSPIQNKNLMLICFLPYYIYQGRMVIYRYIFLIHNLWYETF